VSDDWRQEYTRLTDFIAEKPEIKIEDKRVRLPENVRPEFYRLFNSTRKKLVAEKLPSLSAEAEILSENYQKSEKEVINLLGLEEITMATTIHTFLHSPMDAVIRALFNPLFDLLKGRKTLKAWSKTPPGASACCPRCTTRGAMRSGWCFPW
jgi:hypothetical protein